MASATKRRKTESFRQLGKTGESTGQPRITPSPAAKVGKVPTPSSGSASLLMEVLVPAAGTSDSKAQQAKRFAVAQAQQDGRTGNFRSFNSHFGNYLLPVIPTMADLNR